ncbi:gamma-aminobutyric acid type B receptor subunit 2-like [Ptychodera flava]|uniref:gamma-aminobutyric acid type B receptor subunit 2-like n=1 Tax=Ptychodera flava TaxID=63121 RepID=UPI00396A37B3
MAVSFGFTISFGAMFSKTWRIHKIFTNKTLITVKIRDWRLLLHVVYFLCADIAILLTWFKLDPPRAVTVELPEEVDENGKDCVYLPRVEVCVSRYINLWLGLICGYKGIVILFGVFLAWETRQVKYAVLNDSRHIGFAVYNVLVMSTMGVPTVVLMRPEQTEAKFLINALCIIFCTTAILCLVFLPKILGNRHNTINVTHDDGLQTLSATGGTSTIATRLPSTSTERNINLAPVAPAT